MVIRIYETAGGEVFTSPVYVTRRVERRVTVPVTRPVSKTVTRVVEAERVKLVRVRTFLLTRPIFITDVRTIHIEVPRIIEVPFYWTKVVKEIVSRIKAGVVGAGESLQEELEGGTGEGTVRRGRGGRVVYATV